MSGVGFRVLGFRGNASAKAPDKITSREIGLRGAGGGAATSLLR